MERAQSFPLRIVVEPFDNGFVVKINSVSTYYPDLENLAKAIYGSVRSELNGSNAVIGNC